MQVSSALTSCHEIDAVHQKKKVKSVESEVNCITNNDSFQPVCLN